MRSRLFVALAAIAVIAGCAKEVNYEAENPAIPGKRLVTINAGIVQTKTTVSDDGMYSWQNTEQIGVVETDGSTVIPFNVKDATAGTFTGELTEGKEPVFAVSPASAVSDVAEAGGLVEYTITFDNISNYVPGTTNALMIGTKPTPGSENSYSFEFRHAAALVKVPVVNVPVGTAKVKLTLDKPITGIWEDLDSTSPVIGPSVAGDPYLTLTLKDAITEPNTSADFYFPVPVNTYTSFQFELLDANDNRLKGVKKSGLEIDLVVADLFITPTISLALEEEEVTVNNYQLVTSGSLTDGDYLIANVDGTTAKVYTGVDENINHSDYPIVDDAISASAALDNLAIEVKAVTGGYTLKVKNGTNAGKYIGAETGNSNGTSFSNNEIVNSIEIDASGIAEVTDNNNSYTHLVFNSSSNTERFRYYKTTTTNGIVSISFFKKVSQSGKKLNTPTGLKVEGKVVSWNPVNNADQYAITIGSISETVNACTYTFTGDDDYYNVSVVAQASDDSRFASNAATLSNAKFGSPTLATPNLKKGAIGENSLTVTWTVDDRAAAGYTCEIKDAGEYSNSTTVEEGSVTFDGLNDETEYTITVVANKVTSPLEYMASEPADITITTAAKTTIKSILDGNDTAAKSLSGVTVLAISSQGVYLGDSTGWIFAQQSSTTPTDLTIGEVVNVSGTAGSQNSQRVLKTSTITRTSGTAISIPAVEDITYADLSTLASSFERKHIRFSGEVATVNASNSYYNITLEGKTDIQIALYRPASTITSSIKVGQTVIMSGYTMHITGSSTKYLYITADSFAIANISVKSTPAQYTFTWDESGTENKQEFEIESDDNNWTIDDSEISSWATVSKSGNKVVVYPSENNESGNDYTGKIYVIHAKVSTLKAEIFVKQEKYVDPGSTKDYYKLVTDVSQITAGTYVVGALRSTSATNAFYFAKASISSGDWVVSDASITVTENEGVRRFEITNLPSGAVEFTLIGDNTEGFTISNGSNYLYYTAASNRKLAFAAAGSSQKWTVSAKSDPLISGGVVLKAKGTQNYTISENSTSTGAIRGYASTTEYRAIYLFKKVNE